MPRALLGGRSALMYAACSRARSASMAARSIGPPHPLHIRMNEFRNRSATARSPRMVPGLEFDRAGQAGHVLPSVAQALGGDVRQVVHRGTRLRDAQFDADVAACGP